MHGEQVSQAQAWEGIDMKKLLLLALATALLVPATLLAQRHDRRDRDDRDDHGRTGRISGVIVDLDRRATEFRGALARALDHSRMDGTRREDRLNDDAKKLDRAVSRLRDSWNSDHDVQRSKRNVSAAIDAARSINSAMERHAVHGHVQGEWDALKHELNRVAEAFDEPRIRW